MHTRIATPIKSELTTRDTIADRVAGLQTGADDYLLKPFDLDELTARLQALLRRAAGRAHPLIEHGPVCVDPGSRRVWRNGGEIELTRREFTLLQNALRHTPTDQPIELCLDILPARAVLTGSRSR